MVPRRLRRIAGPLVAVVLLISGAAGAADFSIDFPFPPTDVASAIASQAARGRAVIQFLACGQEADVMPRLFIANSDAGEGLSAILMAKLAWLGQLGTFDDQSLRKLVCTSDVTLKLDQVSTDFSARNGEVAEDRARREIDPSCDGFVQSARIVGDLVRFTFEVNGLCMRAQVNKIIPNLVYTKQVGTNELPCLSQGIGSILTPPIVPGNEARFSQPGDQDMDIRDLTRVYFLNEERALLTPDTRAYLRDKLLTLHGAPDEGAYSLFGCGNTEQSSGTPQELLDERDFLDDTLDDLGDAALWFARRAALFALLAAPVAAAVGALAALIGAGAAVPTAALATVITLMASTEIADLKIPETENHRLMIESSRFLKNQIILDDEPRHPNIRKLQADQDALKRWLLGAMGEIMRHDFAEFNSRPYQRLSHFALFNLADFSTDDDVRRGARMVLEFALAKFALASREGIRVAPYRRLVEYMNKNPNMLDFGGEGSDHPIATMLYYAGQTQRLPTLRGTVEGEKSTKALSYGAPSSLIYAATSSFAPGDPILDLVIDKTTPYFQRIHHAGIEIYGSAPGFTVAAGGIRTPQALTLQVGPIIGARPTDLGTGVPTSLIPSGTGHVDRLRFLRFDGAIENVGDVDPTPGPNLGFGAEGRIYDHNTCVYRGFACGINYQDAEPLNQPPMESCFVPGLDGAPSTWRFMNSKRCAVTASAPAFFVARFLRPCGAPDLGCVEGGRFGFFEAVDVSTTPAGALDAAFDAFRRRVVADNPAVFAGNPSDAQAVSQDGAYRMFGGRRERLVFNAARHQKDADRTGIVSVDGTAVPNISAWPLAEGEVLHATGDGVVRFTNPKLRNTIMWDFSDAQHPKRTPTAP